MTKVAGDTRHVDYRPASRPTHMWNHESGKKDWRPEIHLQDLIDRFRLDGFGRSNRHHRGVVHQAIDTAEGRGCSFHKRGELRHVSQIDWYGKNLGARFLNHLLR